MSLLYWCKLLGIKEVTVTDIHLGKKGQVEEFNGRFLSSEELKQKPLKYNVIFETSGVIQNVQQSFELADREARLILIGQTKRGEKLVLEDFLRFYDGMTIISSQGGLFNPEEDMQKLVNYVSKDEITTKSLISDTISLYKIYILVF